MTANAQHAPVMADVAKVAGVSHQTVSRVINGMPNIKDSTRKRVEAAIKELGYRPNTAARALVTRKSSTIGIIKTLISFDGTLSSYWIRIFTGALVLVFVVVQRLATRRQT